MDKVRFGRALGQGTRAAARSLWEAADAAVSPDPRPQPPTASRPQPQSTASRARSVQAADVQAVAHHVLEAHATVHHAKQQVRKQVASAARQGGRSALAPVRKFSSVLWLEVTGSFFALVAAFLATGLWRLRATALAPVTSPAAHRFYIYSAVFIAFSWFAISSFLRARKRSRAA